MPFVRSYVRSDGTPVRGHSRWAPGGSRSKPGEGPVGNHPIRFDQSPGQPPASVSAPRPTPTVSYPVDFSTLDGH